MKRLRSPPQGALSSQGVALKRARPDIRKNRSVQPMNDRTSDKTRTIERLREENFEIDKKLMILRYESEKKVQAEILLRTQMEKRLLKEQLKRSEMEKKCLIERLKRMEGEKYRKKSHAQSKRNHQFSWFNKWGFEPSDAIMKYILEFLNDDDLFRLRETSLIFYDAFYSQEVLRVKGSLSTSRPFNATRAIKLALKGRVFTKIQALHTPFNEDRDPEVYSTLSSDDLSVIDPKHFPRLHSLRLGQTREGVSLRGLPPHNGILFLTGPSYEQDDYMYITDEKFPVLKRLDLFYNFTARFTRLSALEELGVDCERIVWKEINRFNFPKLLRIRVRRNNIPEEEQIRFKSLGIECSVEMDDSEEYDEDEGSDDDDSEDDSEEDEEEEDLEEDEEVEEGQSN